MSKEDKKIDSKKNRILVTLWHPKLDIRKFIMQIQEHARIDILLVWKKENFYQILFYPLEYTREETKKRIQENLDRISGHFIHSYELKEDLETFRKKKGWETIYEKYPWKEAKEQEKILATPYHKIDLLIEQKNWKDALDEAFRLLGSISYFDEAFDRIMKIARESIVLSVTSKEITPGKEKYKLSSVNGLDKCRQISNVISNALRKRNLKLDQINKIVNLLKDENDVVSLITSFIISNRYIFGSIDYKQILSIYNKKRFKDKNFQSKFNKNLMLLLMRFKVEEVTDFMISNLEPTDLHSFLRKRIINPNQVDKILEKMINNQKLLSYNNEDLENISSVLALLGLDLIDKTLEIILSLEDYSDKQLLAEEKEVVRNLFIYTLVKNLEEYSEELKCKLAEEFDKYRIFIDSFLKLLQRNDISLKLIRNTMDFLLQIGQINENEYTNMFRKKIKKINQPKQIYDLVSQFNILEVEKSFDIIKEKITQYIEQEDNLSLYEIFKIFYDMKYDNQAKYINEIMKLLADINTQFSINYMVSLYQEYTKDRAFSLGFLDLLEKTDDVYTSEALKNLIIDDEGYLADLSDEEYEKIVSIVRKKYPEKLIEIIMHAYEETDYWIPSILKVFIKNKDEGIINGILYALMNSYDYSLSEMIKETLTKLEIKSFLEKDFIKAVKKLKMLSYSIQKDIIPLFLEKIPDLSKFIEDTINELFEESFDPWESKNEFDDIEQVKELKNFFKMILSISTSEIKNNDSIEDLDKIKRRIKNEDIIKEIKNQIVNSHYIIQSYLIYKRLDKKLEKRIDISLSEKGMDIYRELNQNQLYFYKMPVSDFRDYNTELLQNYLLKKNSNIKDFKMKLYSFFIDKKYLKISGSIIFLLIQIQLAIENIEDILMVIK